MSRGSTHVTASDNFKHDAELHLLFNKVFSLFLTTNSLFHNPKHRLTFWLSNAVVLRAIISQASAKQQLPRSAGHLLEKPGGGKGNHKKSSPLKWKEPSPSKETKGALCESFEDWDDPHTFTSALERIETWIYSRIIESLWWQVMAIL